AKQTNQSLTISSVKTNDAGTYQLIATNPIGSTSSTNAVLSVGKPVAISTQPKAQTGTRGAAATFSVAATGLAPITYQWYGNGEAWPGQIGTSLKLTNIQLTDEGSYYVMATNALGSAKSSSVKLTVKPPPIITEGPISLVSTTGASVSFTVIASGR